MIKIELPSKQNQIEIMIENECKLICEEIDKIIQYTQNLLKNKSTIEQDELEYLVMEIPAVMYSTVNLLETYTRMENVYKFIEKMKMNEERKHATGTVAEKQAYVENMVTEETLKKVVSSTINKIVEKKLEIAKEMLNSVKKILSIRITEYEISNNKFINKSRRD